MSGKILNHRFERRETELIFKTTVKPWYNLEYNTFPNDTFKIKSPLFFQLIQRNIYSKGLIHIHIQHLLKGLSGYGIP